MKNSYGMPLTLREWFRYYLPYRLSQWWREFRWSIGYAKWLNWRRNEDNNS